MFELAFAQLALMETAIHKSFNCPDYAEQHPFHRFMSNDVGEINCFLMRVILRNFISVFTGAESRATLKSIAQNTDF